MEWWSGRWTDGFAVLLLWRGSWGKMLSFQFTCSSFFQPLPMVVRSGFDQKNEVADKRKRLKLASFRGWLGSDRVRSSTIQRKFRVEWYGHLIRAPPGHLHLEAFLGMSNCKEAKARPRTSCRDYISHQVWECLGFPRQELKRVAGERDGWVSLLNLLPQQPKLKWVAETLEFYDSLN